MEYVARSEGTEIRIRDGRSLAVLDRTETDLTRSGRGMTATLRRSGRAKISHGRLARLGFKSYRFMDTLRAYFRAAYSHR